MAQSKMEADPIIICMICLDYPNEPVNCRHCSNFVCTHCIDVLLRIFTLIFIYTLFYAIYRIGFEKIRII